MSASAAVPPLDLASLPAIDARCRATVIVPAKDEQETLPATLDALRTQVALDQAPLPYALFEVLLLLNNCTDLSAQVAHRYRAAHPHLRLHVLECELRPEEAHVGTARRALMDLACERLEELGPAPATAILSTDADTLVAPDWIAQNLAAIEAGAEVVGGVIHLFPADLDRLDRGTRLAYERDRELQRRVARLEALLDPDPADPWPRHLEHFGASLACTPEVYRRSGGLPAVKPLEDVAFIDRLRRVGARIRHAPAVHIETSARLDGRAEVGLSGQLRVWQRESAEGTPHVVESAEWLEHRFRTMGRLRRLNEGGTGDSQDFAERWRGRLVDCLAKALPTPRFLEILDCDALIDEMFTELEGGPARHAEITEVLAKLARRIQTLEAEG